MKNTIVKYGTYGLVLAIVLFLVGLYFGQGMDFSTQEIVGYATMIASLTFVFFGIKHFRDKENAGRITFGKGLTIGLAISLFTAAGIAIADYAFTRFIHPDFYTEYAAYLKAQGHTDVIPDYGSGFMSMVMFLTVLIIGLIISIISAFILQNKD